MMALLGGLIGYLLSRLHVAVDRAKAVEQRTVKPLGPWSVMQSIGKPALGKEGR